MAWTTPTTQNPGDAILASLWNTQVKDNLLELAPFFAAATSYTPVWSGLSLGNGSTSGRYIKIGRWVMVTVQLTWGSTSTGSGSFTCTLPAQAATFTGGFWIGSCRVSDAGVKGFPATVEVASGGTGISRIVSSDSGGTGEVNSTTPFTWGSGDQLFFTISYESAS